jgi:hypothetical protein
MNMRDDLRRTANEKGRTFLETFDSFTQTLKPQALMEEALHRADPELSALKQVERKTRQNPFGLLVAASGVLLLARQWMAPASSVPRVPRKSRAVTSRKPIVKGESHGYNIDTDRH